MAGIFHALFGCIIGLLIWKLSEGKNGEKRYSLALIFIFAFNNYIGPDIGVIFKSIGNALDSDIVREFYGIHSYFGFLLFALPYAIGWYAIMLGIERARIINLQKHGLDSGTAVLHASYPKVLLMVEAGGIMHNFVDSIAHSPPDYTMTSSGYFYTTGRFVLIPTMGVGFLSVYLFLVGIIAVFTIAYLAIGAVRGKFTIREKIASAFNRETLWASAIVGIVVLNTVAMYILMEYNGLLVISSAGANFSLGNLLHAATTIEAEAEWWIAASAGPTIFLFFLCHAKAWRMHIAGRSIRADLFVVLCFIASILIGYALQPLIGNISGSEADLGALLYTWSTIGSAMLAFVLARDTLAPNRVTEVVPPSTR